MKVIALCFNTPGMETGEWKEPGYGKKYPGAGWMRHLNIEALKQGITVIDGKGCIDLAYDPKDVHIVQEEINENGLLLQSMGAKKSVLTCLESPIFASRFYDEKEREAAKFQHSILFDGGTDHLYFPSFDIEDIRDPVPWSNRKFLCMVSANKHYSALSSYLKSFKSFKWAMETQLHDTRYGAIDYFINRSTDFDLYGRGWPSGMAFQCEDKLETIRNYKFALCFENGSYPGYVTEKIIDCFVAGVIPVYKGAPLTDLFTIPEDLWVNVDFFRSFEEVESFLRDLSVLDQMEMINSAQRWLLSSVGLEYSNVSFAKQILEMCG